MSFARSIADLFSKNTSGATDAEVVSAISNHNTSANGHVKRGNTESRPAFPSVGDLYFDTTVDSLIQYKSFGWSVISPVLSAPTNIVATAGSNANASIAFTDTINTTVSFYTVTSSPGNITSIGTSSPITVTNLTNGTSYTFTVTANNANGSSPVSTESNSITASTVPTISGGTLTSDSTYYYRTFTSTGSLNISGNSAIVDFLIIGGGGSGARGGSSTSQGTDGGGGGAGKVTLISSATLAPGAYVATIGAGGAGPSFPNSGNNGTQTSFNSQIAIGGNTGSNATWPNSNGGTSGSGQIGGTPNSSSGGGGGGESNPGSSGGGTLGGTGGSYSAGNGGNGTSSYSSWGASTSTGQNSGGTYYYGGGGGGATYWNSGISPVPGAGAGGLGGGGNGMQYSQSGATNGSANTGGGGGGANATNSGMSGGSGLVIVRYTKSSVGG